MSYSRYVYLNNFNKATRCVASTKLHPQSFLLHASYVTKAGKLFIAAFEDSSNQRREYRQQSDPVELPLKPRAERPEAM